MDRGQCVISCCPVRAESSDRSEMVTQLLYGETYSILQKEGNWLKIKIDFDGYEGWLSLNQHSPIFFEKRSIQSHAAFVVNQGVVIPLGAELPNDQEQKQSQSNPIDLARMFMNTPYLWGGKTFMGIDCSGLVQVIFKACGIDLPRDANQQVANGKPVKFGEHLAGDLAFFKNAEGRIIHVGILSEPNKIIHASGRVREDILNETGIFRQESNSYSHQLAEIRRISYFKKLEVGS